jgi:hypothetical protein
MSFLIERILQMIKEKYKQLCLFSHIGRIYTVEFTQTLTASLKTEEDGK